MGADNQESAAESRDDLESGASGERGHYPVAPADSAGHDQTTLESWTDADGEPEAPSPASNAAAIEALQEDVDHLHTVIEALVGADDESVATAITESVLERVEERLPAAPETPGQRPIATASTDEQSRRYHH